MPPSIRPLALALTLALTGAAGVASAAPAPGQDPQASPPSRHATAPRPRHAPPPARQQEATRPTREQSHRERPRSHRNDQLSDSVRRVERRTRGRVLSAESMPYDGRSVSRIKVIDDSGRVRVIVDDPQAASGKPRTRRDDD